MRNARVRVGLSLAAFLTLVACGDGATGSASSRSAQKPDGPYAVGFTTRTFVDPSRPTAAAGDAPARDSRTLPTKIWYPAAGAPGGEEQTDAPPALAEAPFALIVFAHGLTGVAEVYRQLYLPWAERGYVVAAPNFPLSSSSPDRPAIGEDYVNQPGDVSFLIDSLLALAADPEDPLHGLIDPDHIGVSGQSLGGFTTMGVGFHTCCADPRIDAAAPMAGRLAPYPGGEYFRDIETPILVLHGDADETVSYASGRAIYDAAPAPRFLVTILGGDHIIPYVAGPSEPLTEPVRLATLAFFDRYLKGRDSGLADLLAVDEIAVARLESEP